MSLGLRTGLLGLSDKPSLLYLLIFLTLILSQTFYLVLGRPAIHSTRGQSLTLYFKAATWVV
ncbi:hypothetical protein BDV30DRAFT_219965 [Aspergillus minisclerotigenes]|uniref:Uncharacterized protein n=1 Tax=Aspergillus minisclerotigenes TaxID=656917 RepID=A0A5N6IMC0_9EURO|nr:hypothetical protein BDV30DRAFT_219965 [Aspergillus minisclerotigenes]